MSATSSPSIANVAGLTSFQFDLAFDPTIITALAFTDIGTDFDMAASTGGGSLTGITGFVDNTTGLLSGIADSIGGLITGNGLTPSGVLVDIDYQGLAPGISLLMLSNAFLTDNGVPLSSANDDFMLRNGQVTGHRSRGRAGARNAHSVSRGIRRIGDAAPLLQLAAIEEDSIPSRPDHRRRRTVKKSVLALALLGMATLTGGPTSAQTFQNGPYYANPSWDQQIPAAQRFIVLSNWNNEAVLDRETGLVWERSPISLLGTGWFDAISACEGLVVGNRLGWRLPNLQELTTLIAPTQSRPALPPGNPFQGIIGLFGSLYWTAATVEVDATAAKTVQFSDGSLGQATKVVLPLPRSGARFWCVRGGSSVSNTPY
jgi:Protein of unknown function (DUF1566)